MKQKTFTANNSQDYFIWDYLKTKNQ